MKLFRLQSLKCVLTLIAACGATFGQQTIQNLQLVSSTRVDVNIVEMRMKAELANTGPALQSAIATVVSTNPKTVVLQSKLTFDSVPANGKATSTDTFTLRHDRSVVFNPAALQWSIQSTPANTAPVANPGPNQTVNVGQTVTLDGSTSSDSDGNPLTFAWTWVSKPATGAAQLNNPAALKPTFVADRFGTYVLQLIVNDGSASSAPATVTIDTRNSAPVSQAGPDQTVFATNTVQLDGSGSSDVDGNSLTYSWVWVSKPANSNAQLNNPAIGKPSFVADKFGSYVLRLVVNDGQLNSAADDVTITTQNTAPVSNAGPDQTTATGATIQLNGGASTDVDGNNLTFAWAFISKPANSSAVLSNSTIVNPTFVADKDGNYVVQLIVHDGFVAGAADSVAISTSNTAPLANAGPDQTVLVNQAVTLNGSLSSDANGDALTHRWALTSKPANSNAAISNSTSVIASFHRRQAWQLCCAVDCE